MNSGPSTWLKIHAYVAMFFLPIAVIFAITGATSALEGEKEHGMRPGIPPGMTSRPAAGPSVMPGELPSGAAARPGEAIEPGEGPERGNPHGMPDKGFYGKLVLMHKAKGNPVFPILAVAFACALLVTYVSGICVMWRNRALRGRMMIAAALGLIVTIVIIATS